MKSKYTGYLQYIYNVQQYSKFESMVSSLPAWQLDKQDFLSEKKFLLWICLKL